MKPRDLRSFFFLGALSAGTVCAAAACAGGQTGEITMLGPCAELHGEREFASLSRGEVSALDALLGEHRRSLFWADGSEAELVLVIARDTTEPLRTQGEGGCEALRVPLRMGIATSDGRLDETLVGAGTIAEAEVLGFRGEVSFPLQGSLSPGMTRGGILVLQGEGLTGGQLFLSSAGDAFDDELLGRW